MAKPTLDNQVMFPTEYLAADDFEEGQETHLTIKDIKGNVEVKTKKGKENHLILYFERTDKKMILKPTNANLIAEALGEREARKWVGRKITLYRTTCDAFGDPHKPCVRVKETAPTQPKPKPASDPVAEPIPAAASGSVPKANRDIAESIAVQETEPVLADVDRVAGLLGVKMGDERWSRLISQGSIRAAINTMLDEVE